MQLAHEPRVQREPVIGWRLWQSTWFDSSGDPRLLSVAVDYSWWAGRNEAQCYVMRPCTEPPGSGCTCGFWGLWTWRRAEKIAAGYGLHPYTSSVHVNTHLVLGLIGGWGRIAIHGTEGFRAQYARPLCLFTNYIDSLHGLDRHLGRLDSQVRRTWFVGERAEHGSVARDLAAEYQVPAVPLHSAARSGLLAEFGVPVAQVEDLRRAFLDTALHQTRRQPSRRHQPPQAGPELTP